MGSNFIATLSAKLTPNLSPRGSRRHSDDLGPSIGSPPSQQTRLAQRGPGQSFLDSLNAKLAQQHITNNAAHPQYKANKIRQIINSKAQVSEHIIVYPITIVYFTNILVFRNTKLIKLLDNFRYNIAQ